MGQCNHLILHCMDYRIQTAINDWIQENGFSGDIDRISMGGACLHRQVALDHIAVGLEKHAVKKVFLVQHEDCAGYGGRKAFSSPQSEKEKLISDMLDLKIQIEERYPNVQVNMLMAKSIGSAWQVTSLESTGSLRSLGDNPA